MDTPAKRYFALGKELLYKTDESTIFLSGKLMLAQTTLFTRKLFALLKEYGRKDIVLNLDELEDIDSTGVMALFHLQNKLKKLNINSRLEGGSEGILAKIELFRPGKIQRLQIPPAEGLPVIIGSAVHHFFTSYVYGFMLLAADVFYWSLGDLFKPRARRAGEVTHQAVLIGVNASLIVVFMSFVIGLVMALQSSYQLRTFGANIYIVDLIVIAMMSQMGPLITAILVAGRSGSAIAAEIATMKVTSELDALKTMGLNPIRFVVVPKLYASLITLPFLIILANVSGIVGGGVAAYVYLDITPEIFINRMGSVMQNKDLLTGFVKSQVYATLIVLTGSFYGFRVDRGAEGVGRVTTTAVVVAISLVILADSLLGLMFY